MASRQLKVEIVGDASSLERALGKASKSSGGLGKSLVSLGKYAVVAGAALGALAAVGMAKAIDAASNLEEQINKTAVVFGDSGDEVTKWSKDLADAFGLSQRAALEAAGTYGNMLVPMGFSRKEAAAMSKQFVELAADMASFNNASPEETLDALRAGLAGETEPLRRFGVFLNEARIKAQALEMGLYSGKGALDAQAKAAATAAIIMKDTADTQGDFSRTSESLANQQRILKAELENASAAIGNALLPAVTALVSLAADAIPVIAKWGTALTEAVGPTVMSAVQGLVPLFENVKQTLLDLTDAARQLWPTLQAIGSTAGGAAMSALGQSAIIATAAMWGFHAVMQALIARLIALRAAATGAGLAALVSPLGLATAAVGALTAAFIYSRGASDVLGDSLNRQRAALKALKDTANEAVSSQDRLRDAKIGVKQATLNVSAAIDRRNQLEAQGKKGTDEYKQAQLGVQQAYAGRIRGEHEVTNALNANREASGKTGAAIRHLGESAEDLRGRTSKLTGTLGEWGKEVQKSGVVKAYATEMTKLAEKADRVSEATRKSNPRIAEAAQHFAANARAAAAYAKRTGEIPPALGKVAPAAESAGKNVGTSFGQGIAAGIGAQVSNIAAAAARSVNAAEAAARAAADAKSPSRLFAKVGSDLVEGMVKGVEENKKLEQALKDKIEKARQAVLTARGNFSSAFGELASVALQAFDAKMSQWKPPAQALLDKRDFERQKQSLVDAITSAASDIKAARAALIEARASGDEEAVKAATQRVIDAEKAKADAEYAQWAFRQQQKAARQQEAHDKEVARDKIHFQDRLGKLQAELRRFSESGGKLTDEESRKYKAHLNDLLKDYGIDAKFWGTAIGISLADGLKQAQGAVRGAALALARMIERLLKTKSPAEEGPLSTLDTWWAPFAETLVSGLDIAAIERAGTGIASTLKRGLDSGLQTLRTFTLSTDAVGLTLPPPDIVPTTDALTTVAEATTEATAPVTAFKDLVSSLPGLTSAAFTAVAELILKAVAPITKALKAPREAIQDVADALHAIGRAAYATRAALQDTVDDIIRLLNKVGGAGGSLQGRAGGGPVKAGQAYVVGEMGPELFIPKQSGTIVAESTSMGSAAGGVTVNVYGDVTGTELVEKVRQGLLRIDLYNPGSAIARG